MRIAVIGAGAIGATVAAYLSKSDSDVLLIGRPDQVEAIKARGLTVRGIGGDEVVHPRAATALDAAYDLVIFATKTQDLERAYQANVDYLEDCYVLTTQNGVQADNILSSHYDPGRQLSSIVMFGATYTTPGEVVYNFPGDWIIGKPYTPLDPAFHRILETLRTDALPVVSSDNIMGMKYLKLFVNFNNCLPALIGKSMQETFADLDFCRLSIRLLKEGVGVVNKANIELTSLPQFPTDRIYGLINMPEEQAAGIMNKTLTGLSAEPLYGSVLQSIMRGRTSEIDFINGEVVALAKGMQQSAPFNGQVVRMVHEVESSGRYFSVGQVKEAFELTGAPSQPTSQ